MYYDKCGAPLTLEDWGALLMHGDYKIVKQERFDQFFVSTVWLGLDYSSGRRGKPVIFETMIFNDEERDLEKMWRYSTLEEALEGHDKAVKGLVTQESERAVDRS